jgi:Fur family transcriptional regulator, ferric uptake regulator
LKIDNQLHWKEMTRDTRQRRAIREVLMTLKRPLSPMEILIEVQKSIPRLGLATVYRNVKTLLESNVIREVRIPGESPRYELATAGHHHHFFCFKCSRVLELEGCRPVVNELVPDDFVQEFHELAFFGTCGDCMRKSKEL